MGKEIDKLIIPIYPVDSFTVAHLIENNLIPESAEIIDIIPGSLKELYEIKHPEKKDQYKDYEFQQFLENHHINPDTYGNYVYYEWRNLLIRIPPVEDLRLLRTARNQLLITPAEQQTLFGKTILIAGMSVGSNAVEQLVHSGIGGAYVLADMDTLEITNLNRIKVGLPDITLPKVLSCARRALELDPYLDITLLREGVNERSLTELLNMVKIDLYADEVDDIAAKVLIRQKAKENNTPVVMATDNSDGAIIDIERYDMENKAVMFNNLIPDEILDKMVKGELSREESGAAIGTYFVGLDLIDNRLLKSLMEVKRTIPSWPQLGTAASMSGLLVAYAAKQILLGETLISDRYVSRFDKDMNPNFETVEYAQERETLLSKIRPS